MKIETGRTAARYEYLVDPLDVYIIWDNAHDQPAMIGGEMVGLPTEEEAITMIELLNRRDRRPLSCRQHLHEKQGPDSMINGTQRSLVARQAVSERWPLSPVTRSG